MPDAEQVADHAHSSHERTFDHVEGSLAFLARFLGVDVDMIDDAFNQCVLQTLFDGLLSPCFVGDRRFAFRLYAFRELDHAFGCVVAAIQQHVFDAFPQLGFDLFVNCQLPGVHDRHVQAGTNCVVKKSGVHRFAYGVVAAKRKRNIADAAADARTWQVLFDPARRFDEIDGVIAMLVETRRDCQNVRIENDVVRGKPGLLRQQIVGARADFDLALEGVGLAFLVERHHDGGCAVSPDQLCMAQKFLFAVFQADRVHDGFALDDI